MKNQNVAFRTIQTCSFLVPSDAASCLLFILFLILLNAVLINGYESFHGLDGISVVCFQQLGRLGLGQIELIHLSRSTLQSALMHSGIKRRRNHGVMRPKVETHQKSNVCGVDLDLLDLLLFGQLFGGITAS